MKSIKITNFTSTNTEHDFQLEENSNPNVCNNNLQGFLSQHFKAESSKFNEIHTILEKVEIIGSTSESGSKLNLSYDPTPPSFNRKYSNEFQKSFNKISEFTMISVTRSAGIQNNKESKIFLPMIKELSFHKESSKGSTEPKKRRSSCPQFQQTQVFEDYKDLFKEFVMIEPISKKSEDLESNAEGLRNLMSLDPALFSKEIIQYVASIQGDDPKIVMKSLVDFLEENKDQDLFYFVKRPKTEMVCSISLKDHKLLTFQNLVNELIERLNEEPISVQQKYKDALLYMKKIQKKLANINKTKLTLNPSNTRNKVEENDLIQLSQYVSSLLKEDYLIASKEILNKSDQFLTKTLQKFTGTYESETFKFRKGIVIDYITLPKLLEKLLESPDFCFCRRFITYTYDFYITPLNLLLFFIYKYFVPEPLNLSIDELESFKNNFIKPRKLRILKLIKFWFEERIQDFPVNPHLIFLLGAFLDNIRQKISIHIDVKIEEAFKALSTVYDNLLQPIPKKIKNHSRTVSLVDVEDDLYYKEKSISKKKTSALTNPLFYFHFGQSEPTEEAHCEDSKEEEEVETNQSSLDKTPQKSQILKNLLCMFPMSDETHEDDTPKYTEILKRSVEDIAKQLTLIDSKEFGKINIREMIVKRWSKKDKSQCPTYSEYVSRFNGFSHWLQYVILTYKKSKERQEIVKKFLDVAIFCLKRFHNYCAAHYIFSAIVSLQSFGVISLEGSNKEKYKTLSVVFSNHENYAADYEKVFRNMTQASVPSLTTFLRIFLKLQEGVVFQVKLPDSEHNFLKFPTLVQIQDYCNEMRRFQKNGFEEIIEKDEKLYKYLKKEFRKEVPINLEDQHEVMKYFSDMANEIKYSRFKSLFQSKKEKG